MELQNTLIIDLANSFAEITLSIAIFNILIYATLVTASKNFGYPVIINSVSWLSIYVLICICLIVLNNGDYQQTVLQGLVVNDSFVLGIRLITLLSAVSCILISLDYIQKDRINLSEATTLILLSILGSFILIGANDLLVLYLAIEMQSLCFYVLATFKRNSNFSTEAGLKYFVLGALASGLLLFGCSLIYGFSGTTNLEELGCLYLCDHSFSFAFKGISTGILFILIAFMFKIAAAPFHTWIPDVYEGAPSYITAYFAIVPKLTLFGLIMKLTIFTFESFCHDWQTLMIACGLTSLFVGCLGALYQKKIKRLLAYSAISHAGYLLIAVSSNSVHGVEAAVFYFIVYILMGLAVFNIVLNNRNNRSSGRLIYLTEFLNFSKTNITLAVIFGIVLFSMAGVPPLAGFLSKMNLFLTAINSGLYIVTIIALLMSGVGSVYYIRVIKIMFFDVEQIFQWYSSMGKLSTYLLVLGLLPLIALIINPDALNVPISHMSGGFLNLA